MDQVEKVINGDRLTISKLISLIEDDPISSQKVLDKLFPHTGQSHIIGITGSPGTGKSSLVNQLVRAIRSENNSFSNKKMAILAVDPSSPFSGGALLGDRIRMRDLSGDPLIFMRSMASHGASGGLSSASFSAVNVLDAAGYDLILVETVGAGQTEVDIARLAHTTLVVTSPAMGDDIQVNKAGILEIADILVVNKSDQAGAQSMASALRSMLNMAGPSFQVHHINRGTDKSDRKRDEIVSTGEKWDPPVLLTNAVNGDGFQSLLNELINHYDHLSSTGRRGLRNRVRLQYQLQEILEKELYSRWYAKITEGKYLNIVNLLNQRKITPLEAVHRLLEDD